MTAIYSIAGLILQGVIINILLIATPAKAQNLHDIKIKMNIADVTIVQVFKALEEKTTFKFLYNSHEISNNEKITLNADGESLYNILDKLGKDYSLSFKCIDNQIVVNKSKGKTESQFTSGEKIIIKGKVVNSVDNSDLQFATVRIENSDKGVLTNERGEFSIAVPERNCVLIVSYVGYKTEHIFLEGRKAESGLLIKMNPVNYLLQEVMVYGKKNEEISAVSVNNEQIVDFAGLTKDALRSVQLLPGVSSNNEASARINVRGGSSDENLILVNDVEVYNPFHLKEISMASVGIFNIDLVKSIDFSAGGFRAEYGNALSSIMKVDFSKGNRDKYSGKIDLSLIDLSALIQGPLSASGSFMVGVRKSYFDYLMKVVGVPPDIHMSYYDFNAALSYDFDNNNKINAVFIYSKDFASQDPTLSSGNKQFNAYINNTHTLEDYYYSNNKEVEANYGNILASVKYDRIFSNKFYTQTIISLYNELEDEKAIENNKGDYSFKQLPGIWAKITNDYFKNDKLTVRTISLKQNFMLSLSDYVNIKAGAEYKNIYYDYYLNMNNIHVYSDNFTKGPDVYSYVYPGDPQYNDTAYVKTHSYSAAGFIENIFQITEDVIINAGIRGDYYDINREFKISPRIGASYKLPWSTTMRLAWGIYYQPPAFRQLRLTEASADNTSCQRADHYILGFENNPSDNVSLKLEGYYKDYSDLMPIIRLKDGTLSYGGKETNAAGYAAGFDIQAVLKFGNTDIWFSYGYLVSKEKIKGTDNYYARCTDQTHTLASSFNFNFGNGWNLSVRGFYGSGYAYTPYNLSYSSQNNMYVWVPGDINSGHYPAYIRIDLRVDKSIAVSDAGALKIYLDIMNIMNHQNVYSFTYAYNDLLNPVRNTTKLFGLLPTLGISYSF